MNHPYICTLIMDNEPSIYILKLWNGRFVWIVNSYEHSFKAK